MHSDLTECRVITKVASRAFTIIELILVTLLIAVFASLLLPALHGAREAAAGVVGVANLRDHAAVFAMYQNDYDDSFPIVAFREGTTVHRCSSGPVVEFEYWSSYTFWSHALSDGYYGGDCGHDSFYAPGYPSRSFGEPVRSGPTPFYYGCSFIARPEYWYPETREGRRQWSRTRMTDVQWPSSKGLLYLYHPLQLQFQGRISRRGDLNLPIAFVDGHAERHALNSLTAGYPRGDGDVGGGSHHLHEYPYGLHTIGGVHGRDVR